MSSLSEDDQNDITRVLVKLYGDQAKSWPVNDRVY